MRPDVDIGMDIDVDVLVMAAFAPELAHVRAALRTADGPVAATGERARVGDLAVALGLVGVGLAAAAVGAATLVGELAPRAVVLVGTCGAYAGSGLAIGDVVVSRRLSLVDPSALENRTQFPPPMATTLEASDALASALAGAGARPADVATTLAITVDDPLALRIRQGASVDVEHLETHGVAMACAGRGVPFAAVLGVANRVGASGREEWLAHHRRVEAFAGECVMRWLRQSARAWGQGG
jgi:futalosine hydrolase